MPAAPTPEQLADAARWAYRLVLGREPEDKAAVARWAALGEARRILEGLVASPEGVTRHDAGFPLFGDWAAAAPTPADLAAVHLLRHGWLPEPRAIAAAAARHADGHSLRAEFLGSPEFRATLDAAGIGLATAEVSVLGRRLRLHGRRHDAYWQVLAAGALPAEIDRLARVVRAALPDGGEGAVLVDGGANIGVAALAMAVAAPRHARLLAVEPDPRNLPLLERNLAENGIDRGEVLPVALGAAPGRAPFRRDARNSATGHLAPPMPGQAPPAGPRVRIERLERLLRRAGCRRLDMLKLDVEGAEPAALEGAGELLARWRGLVFAEFNLWTLMTVARRNPLDVLEAWAARVPHLVAFDEAGAPSPLADRDRLLWFLYVVTTERRGLADLVLCHDLGWLGRWP